MITELEIALPRGASTPRRADRIYFSPTELVHSLKEGTEQQRTSRMIASVANRRNTHAATVFVRESWLFAVDCCADICLEFSPTGGLHGLTSEI